MREIYFFVGILFCFSIFPQITQAEVTVPLPPVVADPAGCPNPVPPAVQAARNQFIAAVTPLYAQLMAALSAKNEAASNSLISAIVDQYISLFNTNNSFYLSCQSVPRAYTLCNDLAIAQAWYSTNEANYYLVVNSPNVTQFQLAQAMLLWGANIQRINNDEKAIEEAGISCSDSYTTGQKPKD